MIDSVEMIRFFTEFTLSECEWVQNDKHGILLIVTQSLERER